MKKTAVFAFALVVLLLMSQEVFTYVGGATAGYSGGASEKNCTWCHTGVLGSGPGTVSLTSDAVGNMYVPGDTYTLTATINESALVRFGFQVLVGYSAIGNKTEGTAILTSGTETQLKASGTRRYVTHKLAGTSGSGSRTWSFKWAAPATGVGPLTFYAGFNGANNNNDKPNDHIYLASLTLDQLVGVEEELETSSDFAVYPTLVSDELHLSWPLTAGAITSAEVFTLNGTQVMRHDFPGISEGGTMDASGWTAGTYIVRLRVGEKVSTHKIVKL